MKGSEKQIKWANDIKAQVIENLSNAIEVIEWAIREDFDDENDWKDEKFNEWDKINKQLIGYFVKNGEELSEEKWLEIYKAVVKNLERMKADIQNEVGKWEEAKTFIDARNNIKDPVFLPSYVSLLKEYGFYAE